LNYHRGVGTLETMCGRIAKYGLVLFLLSMLGFTVAGILAMAVFVKLWYSYPGAWTPLHELPAAPETLLEIEAPGEGFLIRTRDGGMYACRGEECAPAQANWSADAQACDATSRPALVSTFRWLLSARIQVALGCERGYTDIARAVYVVYDSRRGAYQSSGVSLIPADAAVVGVGVLGGLAGFLTVFVIGGIVVIMRLKRAR
jgi:hypothetical protein